MNKKVAAAIFLVLTLLIALTLGSYNFYVSNAPAIMPVFAQQYEGFSGTKPTPSRNQKDGFAGVKEGGKSQKNVTNVVNK